MHICRIKINKYGMLDGIDITLNSKTIIYSGNGFFRDTLISAIYWCIFGVSEHFHVKKIYENTSVEVVLNICNKEYNFKRYIKKVHNHYICNFDFDEQVQKNDNILNFLKKSIEYGSLSFHNINYYMMKADCVFPKIDDRACAVDEINALFTSLVKNHCSTRVYYDGCFKISDEIAMSKSEETVLKYAVFDTIVSFFITTCKGEIIPLIISSFDTMDLETCYKVFKYLFANKEFLIVESKLTIDYLLDKGIICPNDDFYIKEL